MDQSIHSYEKALAISRSLTTDAALRSRSTCLLNYGTLLRQLGLPVQARRAYEEALEIDRRRQDPGVVEDLTNLGNILADELGQPLIGLSLLEEALDRHRQLVEKGEERDTIAATLDSLAWTYRKLGKPHQALTLYQEALEVDQRDQYQRGIIETSNNLAELYSEELGDEDTAFAIYSENLDLIQSFPDANPDDVWKTHDGLGRIHLRRGNSRQADQHFLMPETLLDLQKGESIRRLLISPDGILHRIPFDALVGSDEAYLGETLRLSVIPSLTWWSRVRQNRQNFGQIKDALVVADPVVENPGDQKMRRSAAELIWADFTFEPIRESQREAATVLKYASLESESLLGRQATVERFNSASPSMFRVLHFATHAVSGATLDTSFLLFGRRNETLDVLTGPMIQDLELDGQLVVLSGCDTAAGRPLSVEGMDSLADAFLMAGANCVIASRWPVSDDAPVPLMKEFYRQLYLGRPVEEALWTAKRQLSGQLGVSVKNWPAFAAFGFCDFTLPIKPSLSAAMTEYARMHWPSLLLLVLMSCGLLICVYRLWKLRN